MFKLAIPVQVSAALLAGCYATTSPYVPLAYTPPPPAYSGGPYNSAPATSSSSYSAARIQYRADAAYRHIDQGIRTGAINRDEAYRLKGESYDIPEDEIRSLRDGRLDYRAQDRLDAEISRFERHINWAKYN